MYRRLMLLTACWVAGGGCMKHRMHVTAVPLSPWNQCEPDGIPYYLPKPLLVVSKNVRHIDESKVGLTNPVPIPNAFDNQAAYADIKANVTVPGSTGTAAVNAGSTALPTDFDASKPGIPDISEKMTPAGRVDDGVNPDSFFTYQVIFVPDLSQKYGLRIKGGPGEVRAAMNLVNGWMYTGMGPYYLKNSSTAQNMMAAGVGAMFAGRGAADVLNEVGELAKFVAEKRAASESGAGEIVDQYERLLNLLRDQYACPKEMCNFAQISIYEPTLLGDGSMEWRIIAEHSFDRHYFTPGLPAEVINSLSDLAVKTSQSGSAETMTAQQAVEEAKKWADEAKKAAASAKQQAQSESGTGELGPGFSTDGAGAAAPGEIYGGPAATNDPTDDMIRKMLKLPAAATSKSSGPNTNVSVNVNPPTRRLTWPTLPLTGWRPLCKPPSRPKVETHVQEYDEFIPVTQP